MTDTEKLELCHKVLKMLNARVRVYEQRKLFERECAYKSAYDMLEYALNGQEDMLRMFDYYPQCEDADE